MDTMNSNVRNIFRILALLFFVSYFGMNCNVYAESNLIHDGKLIKLISQPTGFHSQNINYIISVDSSDAVQINKNLHGINQPFPLINMSTREILSLPQVDSLNMKLLRFPGGTLGNYYRWEFDGFNVNDLEGHPNLNTPHRRRLFKKYGNEGKKIGYEDFINWLAKKGLNGLFVLNVLTETNYENIITALHFAKSKGISISYCEIGNELYYLGVRGNKLRTVQDYIEKVKPLIIKLKTNFPEMKVGIPISENLNWNHGIQWNKSIESAKLNMDACVIHPYLRYSESPTLYLDSKTFRFVNNDLHILIKRLRSQFPGKKIWITEWNIIDKPKFIISKTFLGALYTTDFFLKILNEPDIELANYHCLIGKSFGLLDFRMHNGKREIIKNYTYFFLEMIGKAFSQCDMTIKPRILSADQLDVNLKDKNLETQAFFSEKSIFLIILNRADKYIQTKLVFDGHQPAGILESLTAPNLNHVLKKGSNLNPVKTLQFKNNLQLPPHSINLITAKRAEN